MLLFLDAKNLVYRSVLAAHDQHPVTIMLKQLAGLRQRYQDGIISAFWDTPRAQVWRRRLLPTYKDRPQSNPEIGEKIAKTSAICVELFDQMGFRQFRRDKMEADDLIYAAAVVAVPNQVIIVSGDSDLTQVSYRYDHVKVYHPAKQTELSRPDRDPVLLKSLIGDTTDVIPGYRGIGPKRAVGLLEPQALREFLDEQSWGVFTRNLMLTDLSLCPDLLVNQLYARKVFGAPTPKYDGEAALGILRQHRVFGAVTNFLGLVAVHDRDR